MDVGTRVLVEMLSLVALVRLCVWFAAWFRTLLWPPALVRNLDIADLVKRSVWRDAAEAPPRLCIWYAMVPLGAFSFIQLIKALLAIPQVLHVPVSGLINFPCIVMPLWSGFLATEPLVFPRVSVESRVLVEDQGPFLCSF